MKGEVKEELAEDDSGAKTSPLREGGDGMWHWFSSILVPLLMHGSIYIE